MRPYSLLIGTGILCIATGMILILLFVEEGGWVFYTFPFIVFWGEDWLVFSLIMTVGVVSSILFILLIVYLSSNTTWNRRRPTTLIDESDVHTYSGAQNTCRECGRQVPDDAVFCPYCGDRLEYY